MFNITPSELRSKSLSDLANLFHLAALKRGAPDPVGRSAVTLMALIRAEQARRRREL